MFAKGFYVYIITNKRNGTRYIGHTDDLLKRMDEHQRGVFEGFSKQYGLKYLVWHQMFDSRAEAFKKNASSRLGKEFGN